MAANLTDDADRLLRIQSWREKAVSHDISHNVGQPNRIATQLCLECITFYRRCLRQLSQNDRLTKPTFTRLSRTFETLALWAHGYNIAHGSLDEALLSSRRARRCYFECLTSLCSTLLSRLPRCCSISELDDEARSLKRTLDAGITCLEDTYQDGDSTASSRSSILASDDNIDEVINDLEVDVDGLIAMDSLITCPADRKEEPMTNAVTAWAPHHAICERVANRFPMAEESVVERLGRATWDSFLRCKELRERSQMSDHDEESPEIVENTPALPARTVTTSARSKDSGLGSSLPTSYAETIMSYQRQGGESVKVPPLPKSATDGVPFDCIVCGKNVVVRTNSAWKNHLFNDLRPYICTFEACSRATPFESRQMWVYHTMNHVLDMPGPLDSDSAAVKCPLCLEDMGPGDVKHLAAHLEDIALGAVTLHADVDSDRSSAATDEDEGYEKLNFPRESPDLLGSIKYLNRRFIKDLNRRFIERLLPRCLEFTANPPSDQWTRQDEHDTLREHVTAQVILKLEGLDTMRDDQAKEMRENLLSFVHKVLQEMLMRVFPEDGGESQRSRDQQISEGTAAHDSVHEEQLTDVQFDVATRSSSGQSALDDDDDYQEFPAQERRRGEAYTAYKDTPCRNLLIYGHCRYKDQGCAFNHYSGNKDTSPPNSSNQEQQQPSKQASSGGFGPSTPTESIGSDTGEEDPKLRILEAQGKRPLERMQKKPGVDSDSGMEDPEFSDSWAQPPWSSAVAQIRGTDRGTSNKEGWDERREESIAWLCCACLSGPCNMIDPLCRNENCQHVRCETCRMTPLTYPGLPTNEQEAKVLAAVDKNGYLVTKLGSRYAGEIDEILQNVGRHNQHLQALEQAFAANPQLSEKDVEEIAKQRGIDIPRVTRWFLSRVSLEESKKKTVLANSEEVASKVPMWSAMASVPVPDLRNNP
ncbi:hypothetical protein GE09DRAFT_320440 [Coniochaeta sp. 2T2.1]|nr:hypothetical protein GE09DRAFT_320440 [Coniochaeta sp. 2T2.1]